MKTYWQDLAVKAIADGLLEYEARQFPRGIVDSDKCKKCKKWVSTNKYPFGLREYHPYKVWIRELKLAGEFLSTGIAVKHYPMWREAYKKPRKPNDCNKKRKMTYDPDQLSLF